MNTIILYSRIENVGQTILTQVL